MVGWCIRDKLSYSRWLELDVEFQVKDQIGSFFYFPSLNFQRAAGGYGGIIVNNRDIIPVPFGAPDGDIMLLIGDWYVKSHKTLNTGSIFYAKLNAIACFYMVCSWGGYTFIINLIPICPSLHCTWSLLFSAVHCICTIYFEIYKDMCRYMINPSRAKAELSTEI